MNDRQLRDKVEDILREYGVAKAAVFGSYARGSRTEDSDVDILVELGRKMNLFDFVGLKLDLEERLGTKVDLVQYKTVKPSLREHILGTEVVFYQT